MAVGVGGHLGGAASTKPGNYQDWLKYHQQLGTKLPTGAALKNRFDAYTRAHGIVTPAQQRTQAAQAAAAQQAQQRQAALAATPSAVDFNQRSAEFQRLDAGNRAELQRFTGIRQLADGTWGNLTDAGKVGVGQYQIDRDNVILQNQINRSLAQDAERRNLLSVNQNAAARGVFNSGIRQANRRDVAQGAARQYMALEHADTQARVLEQNQTSAAVRQYLLNTFGPEEQDKAANVWNALKAKGIVAD